MKFANKQIQNKRPKTNRKRNSQIGRMVDRELLPPLRVDGGGVQGGVVAHRVLPFAVEVVGHHVDEVQIPVGGTGLDGRSGKGAK